MIQQLIDIIFLVVVVVKPVANWGELLARAEHSRDWFVLSLSDSEEDVQAEGVHAEGVDQGAEGVQGEGVQGEDENVDQGAKGVQAKGAADEDVHIDSLKTNVQDADETENEIHDECDNVRRARKTYDDEVDGLMFDYLNDDAPLDAVSETEESEDEVESEDLMKNYLHRTIYNTPSTIEGTSWKAKKNRIKETSDPTNVRPSTAMRCTICHEVCHNMRSCQRTAVGASQRNNSRKNIRRNRRNAQATQRDIEADVPLSQVLENMRSRNKKPRQSQTSSTAMAKEILYVPQPPPSQPGTQGSNQARCLNDFVANIADTVDFEW
ncbi:hypothetical protein Salat_1491300 [Sesamum alatum]|uniref:Uncharacterized protein n=1 Tax=Sesamum alatum TaxID=300844 RepID=A0AAE1YBJ9_9LAMI|nr:hypothetical protein Salat_1491300 [Sesamum alatum]